MDIRADGFARLDQANRDLRKPPKHTQAGEQQRQGQGQEQRQRNTNGNGNRNGPKFHHGLGS